MSLKIGRARIGCSGWQYNHWRGDFYRQELPQTRWLEHYTSVFDTVELNNSFYRLPEAATFARWGDRVPMRFVFAVKASRYLTHMKKLKDPEEPIERLFSRMRSLGRHLGPVLYQLPPGFKADIPRLEHFLHALPQDARHVLEFRDPSWYVDAVYQLMERYRTALCLQDMSNSATGRLRVGPLVYVRFHGPSGRYHGGYTDEALESWAGWLNEHLEAGTDVFAYFNNDIGGHAPRDALTLRRMMGQKAGLHERPGGIATPDDAGAAANRDRSMGDKGLADA
jgi:uncharacterized protein YecE (DUF72 family)